MTIVRAFPKAGKHVGDIRIGTSGWSYPPWRGSFFPKNLPHGQELWFASRAFRALEINGTFYRLQTPETYLKWASETPEDFTFTVKAPRFITHTLRLRDVRTAIANFFASGILALEQKLGAILWQLPQGLEFEPELFKAFFAILPHDTPAAADLAGEHDGHVAYRPPEACIGSRRIRHALEVRNDSFRSAEFLAMLRRYDIALVCADAARFPLLMDATSDFIYCRLHGSEKLYESSYGEQALSLWAERLLSWANGMPMREGHFVDAGELDDRPRDVYMFFDNTMTAQAPQNALDLVENLADSATRPERPSAATHGLPQSAVERPSAWSDTDAHRS